MPASEPSQRRQVPVRLTDLDPDLVSQAARELLRTTRSPRERDQLRAAVLDPTEVFYVTDATPPVRRAA